MMQSVALEVDHVTKTFRLHQREEQLAQAAHRRQDGGTGSRSSPH